MNRARKRIYAIRYSSWFNPTLLRVERKRPSCSSSKGQRTSSAIWKRCRTPDNLKAEERQAPSPAMFYLVPLLFSPAIFSLTVFYRIIQCTCSKLMKVNKYGYCRPEMGLVRILRREAFGASEAGGCLLHTPCIRITLKT